MPQATRIEWDFIAGEFHEFDALDSVESSEHPRNGEGYTDTMWRFDHIHKDAGFILCNDCRESGGTLPGYYLVGKVDGGECKGCKVRGMYVDH